MWEAVSNSEGTRTRISPLLSSQDRDASSKSTFAANILLLAKVEMIEHRVILDCESLHAVRRIYFSCLTFEHYFAESRICLLMGMPRALDLERK